MPGVYEITCSECDLQVKALASTWVVMADGTEHLCPHPLERRKAEEATGESFAKLTRDGRVRYKQPLICLACGEHGDYTCAPARTHVGSIVRGPTPKETKALRCASCGAAALYPIVGSGAGLGCLGAVAAAVLAVLGIRGLFTAIGHGLEALALPIVAIVAAVLLVLPEILRGVRRAPQCPRCKRGRLVRKLVAVS